jgi:hypothetical protein
MSPPGRAVWNREPDIAFRRPKRPQPCSPESGKGAPPRGLRACGARNRANRFSHKGGSRSSVRIAHPGEPPGAASGKARSPSPRPRGRPLFDRRGASEVRIARPGRTVLRRLLDRTRPTGAPPGFRLVQMRVPRLRRQIRKARVRGGSPRLFHPRRPRSLCRPANDPGDTTCPQDSLSTRCHACPSASRCSSAPSRRSSP